MDNDETEVVPRTGFFQILRRLWPSFLIYNSYAFTLSAIFINFLVVSTIIWPSESFHSSEMGILVGVYMYMMAFSGILFGVLADRYSRKFLMVIAEVIFGLGYLLNGFVPQGLGMQTFIPFLLFNLMRGFAAGGIWPIINSYGNDSTAEDERSQFFGMLQALFQLFQIVGMVISAFLFQNLFWRQYFWIVGTIYMLFGLLILIRGKEPKRASTHKELEGILSSENVKYEYKLNKSTIRSTVFAPTNVIAFVEGIFTTVMLMIPDFLFVPYIQSEPHNFSPFASSIFMIMFGLPGGLLGSLALAKLSDKLAKRNIRNRVYMIVISIVGLFLFYVVLFFLPLPHITVSQGNNLGYLLSIPIIWIMGMFALIARGIVGLWNINQPPILQAINLPEAQGTISSANQFLENLGSGTGPIIAGALLTFYNNNFQVTVSITMGIGIIGALIWLLAARWINRDVERISGILKQRGIEMSNNNQEEN